MGGRGSFSSGSRNSAIGHAAPLELENERSRSSFNRSKQIILAASDIGGGKVEIAYSKAASYEHPNKNTTIEKHSLKAGFYTQMGDRTIHSHNINFDMVKSFSGKTYDLKGLLKEEGFHWDRENQEWRR